MASFTAQTIGTTLAWKAAQRALTYLPESWQTAISGGISSATQKDYLENNIGYRPIVDISDDVDVSDVLRTDDYGDDEDEDDDSLILLGGDKKLDTDYRYFNTGENQLGAYATMLLKVIGMDSYMLLPCINGSPKITMNVEGNQLPLASNSVPATTTTRIMPKIFEFNFPIAYLRVYGENDLESEVVDNRSKLEKYTDSVKEGWNSINPLGSLDIANLSTSTNYYKPRTIPSYEQIYTMLSQFHTQYGCYLYMGFGEVRIPVNCKIQLSATDGETDAVMVHMILTEKHEFDFNALATVSMVSDSSTGVTNTSSVSGSTTTNGSTSI